MELVLVVVALAVVGWFYYFTVRTSGDLRPDADFDYYNRLVDGFRAGHLYLPLQPSAELMALPDPYDPSRNARIRLPDASYFHGRYYLYWGVAPVLTLMLPYTAITGQHLPQAAALLVYCWIGLGAASFVWVSLRRRFFPASAMWLGPAGVLLLGFGTHVLSLARRPEIWEMPIAACFAFLMLAVLSTYSAIVGRRPVVALGLAGLFLGLAVASRPTALFALGLLVPAIWYLRSSRGGNEWLRAGIASVVALGVIGIGLGWYNYARFGSPFQFGQAYQLTGLRESTARHFSVSYFWYNVRAYFAWPVHWTSTWPFLASRPLPPGPPGYYSGEEMYWLAVLFPFNWFALVALASLGLKRMRYWPEFRCIAASIAAAFVPSAALILCFFYAAERYMSDFTPMLMVLALLGALAAEQAGRRRWIRTSVRTIIAVAAVASITFGVLASFDYHGRSMRRTAPEAWARLAHATEPMVGWVASLGAQK